MGAVRQTMLFAIAVAGGLAFSQAPEFAQQYRQRIGGALEELGRTVAEFDADSAKSGLTRAEALERHASAAERLFRDRGDSMARTVARLQTLESHERMMEDAPAMARPLVLLAADETLLAGVWRSFEPAVPVTPHGLAWAALGFFAGAALGWLAARLFAWAGRAFSARAGTVRRAARGSG